MALTEKLTAVANAIRAKTGKSSLLTLAEMPSEIASISGGGASADVPFEFGGVNAEFISEYSESYDLPDTSFVIGQSASATATSIRASVSNAYTDATGSPTIAFGDKDIVVVQTVYAKPVHGPGATGKSQQIESVSLMVSWFSKRKTSDTSKKTARQVGSLTTIVLTKYYGSSGAISRAVAPYGFYSTLQPPTVASATAASTYVRVSSPSINYRVATTYETAENIKAVTACTWDWNVKIYTVDPFSSPMSFINDFQDSFLSGVSNQSMPMTLSFDEFESEYEDNGDSEEY